MQTSPRRKQSWAASMAWQQNSSSAGLCRLWCGLRSPPAASLQLLLQVQGMLPLCLCPCMHLPLHGSPAAGWFTAVGPLNAAATAGRPSGLAIIDAHPGIHQGAIAQLIWWRCAGQQSDCGCVLLFAARAGPSTDSADARSALYPRYHPICHRHSPASRESSRKQTRKESNERKGS